MAATRGWSSQRDGEAARFLAEATHELRGGAARLALMAEALAHVAPPAGRDGLSPRLDALAAEGRRVQALAAALLDVVQLSEQGRRLDPVPVPVAPALADVVAGEPTRPDRTVTVTAPERLVALADPLALHQILANLFANALRHGGPHIALSARADTQQDPGVAVVTVSDDGPGVAPERVDSLFAPFPRGVGDGLGLSIAARLADLLGGDLTYEPAEPHGARFVLRLPLP
jgi:two-component system OmpR family sensor kinase